MKMNSRIGTALRAVLFSVLLALPPGAVVAAGVRDALDKGPKVGTTIPHWLMATDQSGRVQDFGTLAGERGLVLLLSRSLGW